MLALTDDETAAGVDLTARIRVELAVRSQLAQRSARDLPSACKVARSAAVKLSR